MYAVYPIHDPQTTKYKVAPIPRGVQTAREKSPAAMANKRFARPAAIICQAVAENGSTSADFQRLASTEPNAQLNDPPSRLIDAHNCTRPKEVVVVRSGHNNTSSPTTPRPSPALPRTETW